MEDNANITLRSTKFSKNLAHHQGLIYSRWYSYMNVANTIFDLNEGINDAALVYIDGPPFKKYYD
jgi:hypothetical protein